MFKSLFSLFTSLIIIINLNAQDHLNVTQALKIDVELNNPSAEINNATAQVNIEGGVPPYQYKWSDKNTALSSSFATSLIEGMEHSISVTDARGNTVLKTFKIPAKSITEIFNSKVQPAVDFLGAILFWDPFASFKIYDPIVYISQDAIKLPHVKHTDQEYYLKSWLVSNGAAVKKNQDLAILLINGEETIVSANFSGTLNHIVNKDSSISISSKPTSTDAPLLGTVDFKNPQPLLHPNGDVVKNTIPFIVIWLMLGSIFFTIRLKFINIRGFRHSLGLASGKYDDPDAPGSITHFQAMATAVSATVGLGNIAGVAVAISLGGAGATFWMFMAGFFGMSLKFAECSMGVKYRFIDKEGRIFGGPMNYLRYGLEKHKLKRLGKLLAGLFAFLGIGASFGGGNMLQSNQAFKIMSEQIPFLQGQGFLFGVGFAVLVGIVIIGGIKSIAKFTGKVVPFMALLYIVGCMVVIGNNIENIGGAFIAIYDGAFSANALKGGFIGVLIVGLQRAAFSNEAGVGSAAIAHSASKTNNPIADGFASLIEPLIDTMLVCTMTALVLIFTGIHKDGGGMGGVELTSAAFGSVVSWFPVVLAVAVFLFAFSTMVSWSYYGMRSWTYLFGRNKNGELVYKILYLVFVVLGASVSLGAVLSFADMMILAMSFPNIAGLFILAPEISADMNAYLDKLKNGKLYVAKSFIKS